MLGGWHIFVYMENVSYSVVIIDLGALMEHEIIEAGWEKMQKSYGEEKAYKKGNYFMVYNQQTAILRMIVADLALYEDKHAFLPLGSVFQGRVRMQADLKKVEEMVCL